MQYRLVLNGLVLMYFAVSVNAASVYKCTKQDKSVIFTDKPCPAESDGKVIYTETAQDLKRKEIVQQTATIRKLIENNQAEAAKEYAEKNQALAIYQNELSAYLKEKEETKAEAEKQKVESEKQQKAKLEQQALAIQKQQLELQKQQIDVDKAKLKEEQEKLVTPPGSYNLYPYTSPFPSSTPCKQPYHPHGCKPSPTPISPPVSPSRLPPMNPPSSGGLNPMPAKSIELLI